MIIECVPPMLVDKAWQHISPHLDKAIARNGGLTTHNQVWSRCVNGVSNLLLFVEDGEVKITVVVTFEQVNGKTAAHVNFTCGGTIKLWQQNMPLFKQWAKQHGAETVVVSGPADVYSRIFERANKLFTTYEMEIG